MAAQDLINELAGKTQPNSITPTYHASVIQAVFDEANKYRGTWASGQEYFLNDEVVDDGFLANCVVASTFERPRPQTVGEKLKDQPDDQVFTTESYAGIVYTGSDIEFTKDGYLTQIDAYVPKLSDSINYRFRILDVTNPSFPIAKDINEPVLVENGWATIALGSTIVLSGTKLRLIVDAWDTGSPLTFNHTWTFQGVFNTGAPPTGGWNRNNQHTIIRYDKTDNTATDRTSELSSVTDNSILTLAEDGAPFNFWEYRVIASRDLGTYYEYDVVLEAQGGTGVPVSSNTISSFSIPQPQATQYSVANNFWSTQPSFATISGFKYFDSLSNPPEVGQTTNAFGIRVVFQEAIVSSDWSIKSSIEGFTGGGTGTTAGEWLRAITDVDLSGFPEVNKVDCFGDDPSGTGDFIVKLGDPSSYPLGDRSVEIHNQSPTLFKVDLQDHTNVSLKTINADNSFIAFFNDSVAPWELVHLRGSVPKQLDPLVYGDFNNPLWQQNVTSGCYIMPVDFETTSNFDPSVTFTPAAKQIAEITVFNEVSGTDGAFRQDVIITSSSADFGLVNHHSVRSGFDQNNAIVLGWQNYTLSNSLNQIVGDMTSLVEDRYYNVLDDLDLATLGSRGRYTTFLDCYSPTKDITVKLLPKSAYGDGIVVEVLNQSDSPSKVTVTDSNDVVLKVIPADHSYAFGFDAVQPNWTPMHTRGSAAITMSTTPYGNMNATERGSLAQGYYNQTGLGSEFSNLPPDWDLDPLQTYTIIERIVTASMLWKHEIEFISSTDDANVQMGVKKIRSGTDFADAIANGWKPLPSPNTFALISTETLSLVAGGASQRMTTLQQASTVQPVGFTFVPAYQAIQNTFGATMDRVDGTLTLQLSRTGGGGVGTLYVWSERSEDNGNTWIANPNSGRTVEVANDGEGYSAITSFYNDWANGVMVRFAFASVGSNIDISAPSFTTPEAEAVTGLSYIWEMSQKS